jgi:long-chain acyl-CoA synthetase
MPAWLSDIARDEPDRIGLREKEFGIWQETTYGEYWELVKIAGMALRALGVEPDDKVAIHSENRLAWVVSDLAAQAIQAVSVGLYSTNPAPEVEYLLGHSESKVLIAEDQEQVDKTLQVLDSLPGLQKIVYVEPRGLNTYDNQRLMSWDDFLDLGRQELAAQPDLIDEMVDGIDPETTATIVYTSGTTGPPKGAMLSHHNLVWTAGEARTVISSGHIPDEIELLSYLPLCHVFGRLYDLAFGLAARATVNFAESIDTVVGDLQEIQPTYFPAPPRIWEKMSAAAQIRMAHASPVKKFVYSAFVKVGMWNADRILERGSRGFLGEVVHRIGWLLV